MNDSVFKKQRYFAWLLIVVALMSILSLMTMAANDEANTAANALYEKGLFLGTGTDADGKPIFDLDRTPTRHEAVIMLVRLLGKETEAKAGNWETPFTDVADWAEPYVGYAYNNGLTVGTGATTFGGTNEISVSQYLTFVLRSLGYENGVDFQWDRAWELSDKIGITNGQYNASTAFTRGDVAIISEDALTVPHKGESVVSVGLEYDINADKKTCTITGIGTCTDTTIVIPETIDGYTVTCIGDRAFSQCENITFIKIPETVEKIGRRAFYGCTGLSEITIPESVIDIGEQVFYKAANLHTVYYNSTYSSAENLIFESTNVSKVVFGGSIVPDHILDDGSNYWLGSINDSIIVKEIEILDSVTSIGYRAFCGCHDLTSITIPDSVISIGDEAFAYCHDLTSITIPDSVTSIGKGTFAFGVGLTNITIPDSVTSIGNDAFRFSNLTSIVIPDSVTTIGDYAFIASDLTSITIPDSVTSIGRQVFCNCDGLTSITIPDSLKSIPDGTFDDCSNLISVTIPDSVTNIGCDAFSNCTNLTSIYFNNTKERWEYRINKGGWDDFWERYADWDENTDNYTIYCTDGIITK